MPYKNLEDRRRYNRERYKNDPEFRARILASSKRNYTPDKKHSQHIRRTYGLDKATYNAMLEKQHGGCAICGAGVDPKSRFKHLHVDHCHKTGKVRGILCFKCNSQVAWLEGNKEAINVYLGY